MSRLKTYILLHVILLLYSLGMVFSKMAAEQTFLSGGFIAYYGAVLTCLCIYAIAWQQIIKVLPLTEAFANKAVTVVWGIVWGVLLFSENVSVGKILGGVIVMIGVVMYSTVVRANIDE